MGLPHRIYISSLRLLPLDVQVASSSNNDNAMPLLGNTEKSRSRENLPILESVPRKEFNLKSFILQV